MGKVLLVGGAGYVGSVLTTELLERGYAVKVLDRLYYGEEGLREVRDRIELIIGDMRVLTPNILDDVDAVINIGGLSNDPTAEYNPQANFEMNTVASKSLAELCIEHGIHRYLFASSCSIYDRGEGDDEKDVLQDETTPVSPRAAYSSSKWEAEKALLTLADRSPEFCPVILRKGTIYGFSPRMRYDLVVNTFVKDAISKGYLTLNYGGEMWRPLVDVRDGARAYIACLQAPAEHVRAQIFNVVYANIRISELALRIREVFRAMGTAIDIRSNYGYKGVRSYRVSGRKLAQTLQVRPVITIEESVQDMVARISKVAGGDLSDPRYYNISWMRLLEKADEVIRVTGSVFGAPSRASEIADKLAEQEPR